MVNLILLILILLIDFLTRMYHRMFLEGALFEYYMSITSHIDDTLMKVLKEKSEWTEKKEIKIRALIDYNVNVLNYSNRGGLGVSIEERVRDAQRVLKENNIKLRP